ncbi:glucokinase [Candidatus Woesearchaeota archaeon]|nr:glucokinase [Candidatus Woesearchaeota archaeon]
MQFESKEHEKFSKKDYNSFILAGDIGGTNTKLAVFGIKGKKARLLLAFHFGSSELNSLEQPVNYVLSYIGEKYKIKTEKACFGVAGMISEKRNKCIITKLKWNVDKNRLLKNTKLKKIFLMNDFEAVGYGINLLEKKDIKTIKSARKVQKAPIVVIGPGTGIGKATLVFNEEKKLYVPMPSEVGHSDFAAQDKFDMELIDFIKKTKKIKESISYDELVAGHGLSSIYLFLKKVKKFNDSKFSKEIENSDYSPEIISKYRNHDKTCSITFKIYKNYFARLAKNCALDAIPLGGLYFVGNISNINKEIFDKEFVKAFESNYRVKELLKKTPIYLVLNTNIGLLGAGFFCAKGL